MASALAILFQAEQSFSMVESRASARTSSDQHVTRLMLSPWIPCPRETTRRHDSMLEGQTWPRRVWQSNQGSEQLQLYRGPLRGVRWGARV